MQVRLGETEKGTRPPPACVRELPGMALVSCLRVGARVHVGECVGECAFVRACTCVTVCECVSV